MSTIKTIKKGKNIYYELWDKEKFVRHIGNATKLAIYHAEVDKALAVLNLSKPPIPAPTRENCYLANIALESVTQDSFPFGLPDVIITDPPYGQEFLPIYDILAVKAAELLKPGGSLVVMTGQSYLPDVFNKLSKHLTYHWTLTYLTPGGQSAQLWARKVNTFWKPVLWFVKGTYEGHWIGDISRSAVNDNDKRFHEWGQSESGMLDLVRRLSKRGDIICDPMMGAGTTGKAALALGRRFVGFDKDLVAYQKTVERLHWK